MVPVQLERVCLWMAGLREMHLQKQLPQPVVAWRAWLAQQMEMFACL